MISSRGKRRIKNNSRSCALGGWEPHLLGQRTKEEEQWAVSVSARVECVGSCVRMGVLGWLWYKVPVQVEVSKGQLSM
jgi:hypothetical protein